MSKREQMSKREHCEGDSTSLGGFAAAMPLSVVTKEQLKLIGARR
jgi:hypothetical protein